MDDDPARRDAMVAEFGLTYPQLDGRDKVLAERYQVRGIPFVLLIDRQGVLRYQGHELPGANALEEAMKP